MSRRRAKRSFPQEHNFALPGVPPGGEQSVTLTEEDERVLDAAWAEIRRHPLKVFDCTLPRLPGSESKSHAHSDISAHHTPADGIAAVSTKPA